MRKLLPTIAAVILVAASCQNRSEAEFVTDPGIRLEAEGKTLFAFDPLTCQMSYDPQSHTFRIMTDNVSDYFEVQLSQLPVKEGETVVGNASWTTRDNVHTEKKIAFKVLKLEGDMIWIHNQASGISACLRVLE